MYGGKSIVSHAVQLKTGLQQSSSRLAWANFLLFQFVTFDTVFKKLLEPTVGYLNRRFDILSLLINAKRSSAADTKNVIEVRKN